MAKTLSQETIDKIESELECEYPLIGGIKELFQRENYFGFGDPTLDIPNKPDFWEIRFTFLLLILAAEGEI